MHLDPELIDELNLLRRFSMGGPVAMDVHDNPDPAVVENRHRAGFAFQVAGQSVVIRLRGHEAFERD